MAELFEKFDLDRVEPRGRRLLRLLGGSVALHLLLLAAVIFIPTVQTALQLTTMLAGTDYVDEDYERADIRERATMITLPGGPDGKFRYPAGYFATASGASVLQQLAPSPNDPVLLAQVRPTPLPIFKPAPKPKPSPSPTTTPTPAASPNEALAQNNEPATGETAAQAGASASPTPELPQKTEAEVDKLAEEAGVKKFPKINSKPFKDLVAKGHEMKLKGDINLDGTIEMTLEADRQPDGTLANIEITAGATSDEKLTELAKEFVIALSASRALAVLEDTKHLIMTLKLDEEAVSAQVSTETPSAARANELANIYSAMLFIERIRKDGRDEAEVFKNTGIESAGKEVIVKFNMSRKQAGAMLSKQVAPMPTS